LRKRDTALTDHPTPTERTGEPTMNRPPAYVCAPYAAELREVRSWHVERATLIARIAIADGLAPLLVHRNIPALFGEEETPASRAIGLDCDEALVDAVARRTNAVFLVLLRDDGSASPGMWREWAAWTRARCLTRREIAGPGVRLGRWIDWKQAAVLAHLGSKWEALVDPPFHAPAPVEAPRYRGPTSGRWA
jgi:hypothetical protein